MLTDVTKLREFYFSPLGIASANSITNALTALWGECKGERVMGIGYTPPWLDRFGSDCERVLNFMPAAQGAVHWPYGKLSATALALEEELPLADSSIDRIVMVHLLEHSENPTETLREIWRVLAPNGKLFIVVPNRRGLFLRSPNGADSVGVRPSNGADSAGWPHSHDRRCRERSGRCRRGIGCQDRRQENA